MFLSYDRSTKKQIVGACLQSNFKLEFYDLAIGCACNRGCPIHSGFSHSGRLVWAG